MYKHHITTITAMRRNGRISGHFGPRNEGQRRTCSRWRISCETPPSIRSCAGEQTAVFAAGFAMERLAERQEQHRSLRRDAALLYAIFASIERDLRGGSALRDESIVALQDVIAAMRSLMIQMRALVAESYAATHQ